MEQIETPQEQAPQLVGLLTPAQKGKLKGKQFSTDSYFHPVQDADDQWVISLEEISQSTLQWIKDLPQIEYKPKGQIIPEQN